MSLLTEPWPWWIAGPAIGLVVPLTYLYAGRKWGLSSTFRDLCAASLPGSAEYLRYDWRSRGGWRLAMAVGLLVGSAIAAAIGTPDVAISSATTADLARLGISDFTGLAPVELFSWQALTTLPGAFLVVVGGFLVGFGTRWANGCTSGHSVSGLASFSPASLVATLAFFAGGLAATWVLLPLVLGAP